MKMTISWLIMRKMTMKIIRTYIKFTMKTAVMPVVALQGKRNVRPGRARKYCERC
jgi:hypothetical protein